MLMDTWQKLDWVFAPRRFMFGADRPKSLDVPGWEKLAFAEDPDVLRTVNRNTGTCFKGGKGNAFLEPLMGDECVFTLDGPDHKKARQIIGPGVSARMVAEKRAVVDTAVDELMSKAATGKTRDLSVLARRISMRVMCRAVLGLDDPRIEKQMLSAYEGVTGYSANLVTYDKRLWSSPGALGLGFIAKLLVRRVDRAIEAAIKAAQTMPDHPDCVLKNLLEAEDRGDLTRKAVRDNIIGTLAAAFDTTGGSLAWVFYWYGVKGDMLRTAIAADPGSAKDRILAFRHEVLRYCPPVEILPRHIEFDQLDDDLATAVFGTPADQVDATMVCPFVHRAHHDAQVYPAPETFDPERFLNDRPPRAEFYFPFGSGERLCLGIHLGRQVLDSVVAHLVDRSLQVSLRRPEFRVVRRNVSIWPGIRLMGHIKTGQNQYV